MQRFAVIGLGRFGRRLARLLTESESEVIAIDREPSLVEAVRDEVALAVCMDATDEKALRAQSVHEVDAAIVGIGQEFESSAMTVATLREIGVDRIIARAENDTQAQILRRIGASETVSPERESAVRWAHRLTLPNLKEYMEIGEGHSLIHRLAPKGFHHKTLNQLGLRRRYGVNIVAIKRTVAVKSGSDGATVTQPILTVPIGETVVLPNDVLIILGANEDLEHLPQ